MNPACRHRFAALALLGVVAAARPAFAEDEGGEGQDDLRAKIVAKMAEIVKLMRENEAALLAASQGSGKPPGAVDVPPPEGVPPPTPPAGMEGGEGRPADGEEPGGTSGAGEGARRGVEELLEELRARGGRIPSELEALVRMIPVLSGGDASEPSQGQEGGKPHDARDAEARKTGERGKPEDPAKSPEPADGRKTPQTGATEPRPGGERPPGEGDASDPRRDTAPAWDQELPPEVRRAIAERDFERVPEKYRALVERWSKALNETKDAK